MSKDDFVTEDGFEEVEWKTCWFIFAGFALAVGIGFALLFKERETK